MKYLILLIVSIYLSIMGFCQRQRPTQFFKSMSVPILFIDRYKVVIITAQQTNIDSFEVDGNIQEGQYIFIQIKATRNIKVNWGQRFKASAIPLPNNISESKVTYIYFVGIGGKLVIVGQFDDKITKWTDASSATRDTMVIKPCDSTYVKKDSIITFQ